MAPPPELSAVDSTIQTQEHSQLSSHPSHLGDLAALVLHNLQFQHDWHSLTIHTRVTATEAAPESKQESMGQLGPLLPRPLVSGVPPRRVYIHPDEQIEMIKAGVKDEDALSQREWVLPSHLSEKWSLRRFAEIFDAIENVPLESSDHERNAHAYHETTTKINWRHTKRVILATVDDDSTIVYYIVHDGIVKPRQN